MDSLLSLQHTSMTAPKFATGANVVPVAGRLTLGHDAAESRAEPEGDTTLALVMIRGVGPGNIAARDIIPIGNGASFNMITAPMEERRARTQPKRESRKFCEQCPELPPFASIVALKKHRKQVHSSPEPRAKNPPRASLLERDKCPMCLAMVSKRHLAKHLKKVHGVTDAIIEAGPPTLSTPPHTGGAAGLLHERPRIANDTTVPNMNEIISGRVYCQQYDCGRGFSSTAHLESHVRFFHSRRIPEQTAEEQEAPSPSKGVVERHAGLHPLEPFCPPTATIAPPRVEGWADDHDPRPSAGPSMSDFGGGCQGINSVGENAVKQPEIADESSTSAIQGSVDAQLKTAPPTTDVLPLCCRMCGSPPTVATRPTVTTCGHLFCLECIEQQVSSTSRCPVCNSSLLLYCLFKLDLSGIP